MREIVKPIESGSYKFEGDYEGDIWVDLQDSFNKELADRAVRNYKKSIEDLSDVSDMDKEDDWNERFFRRFHCIVKATIFYLGGGDRSSAYDYPVMAFVFLVGLK